MNSLEVEVKALLEAGYSQNEAATIIVRRQDIAAQKDKETAKLPFEAIIERLALGRGALPMPTLSKGRASGIPGRYDGVAPKRVFEEAKLIFEKAWKYLEGFSSGWPGVILYGPLGTGKTSAACEVMRMFEQREIASRFEVLYDMVLQVKETWNQEAETTEREFLKNFTRPALLVVDEAGVQFGTVAEKNVLYEVIVGRHNACVPTIITTNCDLNTPGGRGEFYEAVGTRIASRFEGELVDTGKWGASLRSGSK